MIMFAPNTLNCQLERRIWGGGGEEGPKSGQLVPKSFMMGDARNERKDELGSMGLPSKTVVQEINGQFINSPKI